jgi:hypothetical protein
LDEQPAVLAQPALGGARDRVEHPQLGRDVDRQPARLEMTHAA